MYPQRWEQPPPAKIDPIVRPGTNSWLLAMAPSNRDFSAASTAAALPILTSLGFLFLLVLPMPWPVVGAVGSMATLVAWMAAVIGASMALRRHIVEAPHYTFEGVPIEGAALDLLADIQHRFTWAEKMFGEVPTGIRWSEVEEQVQVLLWEAAEHAAKVSAIDHESRGLGYANPGTPQAAWRDDLERRRTAYWAMLEETQREADDLAREASNAAAAARIALRTGTLAQLERLTPSGANLVARGTLAAARARLHLLAEVWSELDETGALRRQLDEG